MTSDKHDWGAIEQILAYAQSGYQHAAACAVGGVIGYFDAGKMATYMDLIEFIESKWSPNKDSPEMIEPFNELDKGYCRFTERKLLDKINTIINHINKRQS